ncbi:hypothetical protein M758_2G226300 [Ceratodon purpureus]|nr:hypothetical protein M758_2G226300 [Ceratodon purpureus]
MATLVSLQLVRVAGVRDYHTVSYSASVRRPKVVSNSRFLQGCGLKIATHARVGSLEGGGVLCCPLWSHLLGPKRNPHVRSGRVPIMASSVRPFPVEQEIKQIAVMFATYGAHLLTRTVNLFQLCPPLVAQVAPAVGLVLFSIWGLGPTIRFIRKSAFKRNDKKWDESRTYNIMNSYMRPISLWIGIILICRAFDPVVLGTEASHAIKQRFVNFVRSLSTVLAFAFCTASLTQQVQRFMMENQDIEESRNIGVQFIGNAVYTSVWVAAVCLFMELLGFSTQKWITAGGFGTVLITLAGREIFTNFLSSIMIHATRPFVDNEWIQTKIEGQEVSGTVEHVGWWSPTVIRGDDREAVHIPNHKFSVSVVRNLSQKTHWRIKTHLGISHLDVSKMTPIVADMRKVLAKHPQVEQQRLHRRVFFDQIDPENQALMILISCFVKTSHFEEYLRVKEIILLDLLKVISHHGARLATPIRSVQRVLDESESRSSPFRDMRNANQTQRRPFLLLDSQVAASASSDDEEDDEGDISEDISRLSAQVAKAAKATAAKDSDSESESEGSLEEQSDLKSQSDAKKPKETVPVGDENSRMPVTVQQNAIPSSDVSPLQDTGDADDSDIRETLMDRIHAGTEETLVRSHTDIALLQTQGENGKPTSTQPVPTSHLTPPERVVELPEEKVPHLYSNNVGLDDSSEKPAELTSPASSDNQGNEKEITTVPSLKVNIDVQSHLTDQDVVKTASHTSTDVEVNDKHVGVGVHVAVASTLSMDDDPWRQPPLDSKTDEKKDSSDEILGGSSPANSDDDPWRQPSTTHAGSESVSSSNDPWTQPSPVTQVHHNIPQPSQPTIDPNLIPGVAIDGPKHTLPLDEDIITLDDSPTLVALGKPNSSKERRESSGHGVSKGAASNDASRDRER